MEPAHVAEQNVINVLADGIAAGKIDDAKVEAAIEGVKTASAALHDASVDFAEPTPRGAYARAARCARRQGRGALGGLEEVERPGRKARQRPPRPNRLAGEGSEPGPRSSEEDPGDVRGEGQKPPAEVRPGAGRCPHPGVWYGLQGGDVRRQDACRTRASRSSTLPSGAREGWLTSTRPSIRCSLPTSARSSPRR